MWIDKLMAKCTANKYRETNQFKEDVHKIVVNCTSYNTTGHGKMATPDLITFAMDIERVAGE